MFQFTRPRGGAIKSTTNENRIHSFNSHAPVGARCLFGGVAQAALWFQFTRPRGGAISSPLLRPARSRFNSHAPVGARSAPRTRRAGLPVSIHTPPWGRDFPTLSSSAA